MSNTEPTGLQTLIIISYESHPCLTFLKSLITHSALKCLIKEEHNVTGTRDAIAMATPFLLLSMGDACISAARAPKSLLIVEILHYYNVTRPESLKNWCL